MKPQETIIKQIDGSRAYMVSGTNFNKFYVAKMDIFIFFLLFSSHASFCTNTNSLKFSSSF